VLTLSRGEDMSGTNGILEGDDGDFAEASDSPKEVVVRGRKYLLVPIDSPAALGQAAASAKGPSVAAPRALGNGAAPIDARERLTSREREIAELVAKGHGNKQIAAELRISEWTVSAHLRRMYVKLGVDTRAAMVTKCFHTPRVADGE
jgi:DNA-binding NarL/FixJ family response regulator